MKPVGTISYLPGNDKSSTKIEIADGLYAIISSYSRDMSTMQLVDGVGDKQSVGDDVQLFTHLDIGTEISPPFENTFALKWDRSYDLMLGGVCVLRIEQHRLHELSVAE